MTDTTPLTTIRARHQAATHGIWYTDPAFCGDPHMVVSNHDGYGYGIASMNFGSGDDADADREFVLNAHTDMDVLLAEVDRLRTELAAAQDKAAAHEHSENLLAGILREGRRLLAEASTPEQAVTDLHTLLNP